MMELENREKQAGNEMDPPINDEPWDDLVARLRRDQRALLIKIRAYKHSLKRGDKTD